MVLEFTARQVKISDELKASATQGLERIEAVLGTIVSAGVIFRAERHMQIVDITLQCRRHSFAATGESATQETALREAMAHVEHQAHRYRDRTRTRKRLPKVAPTAEARAPRKAVRMAREADAGYATGTGNGTGAKAEAIARAPGRQMKAAITVHSFPGKPAVVEPHILSAAEAIAVRPMTVEEAVKEAEFRDRDLLVFRDPVGDLFVLHRRRDGKMELVEVP